MKTIYALVWVIFTPENPHAVGFSSPQSYDTQRQCEAAKQSEYKALIAGGDSKLVCIKSQIKR